MQEISDHAKNLTLSDDLEKTLEDRVNMFYNFVKVNVMSLLSLVFLYTGFCALFLRNFVKKKKIWGLNATNDYYYHVSLPPAKKRKWCNRFRRQGDSG